MSGRMTSVRMVSNGCLCLLNDYVKSFLHTESWLSSMTNSKSFQIDMNIMMCSSTGYETFYFEIA